jgi:glutamate formiminotransferase
MLLAVPNVSEGRDLEIVRHIAGHRALDVHADPDHNRAVMTYADEDLAETCVAMAARAIEAIDLRRHDGVHPRTGVIDVLPFVHFLAPREDAIAAADVAAARFAGELGVPVYRYDEQRPLPAVRAAIARGEPPDVPSATPRPGAGITCIGVRPPLIAFNINVRTTLDRAQAVAHAVRERDGGLPGVRALAFPLPSRGLVQVSMNLTAPDATGPRAAFDAVRTLAGGAVVDAEVVGLVPDAFLAELAELPLRAPARGIADALRG